jgi:hypothetical protein
VKRWHGGDQRERWVGSGLLVAEKRFRLVKGHKLIPVLLRELESFTPPNRTLAERRRKLSYRGAATFYDLPGIPEASYAIAPMPSISAP